MPVPEVQRPASGWVKRVLIGRDPKRTLARVVIWVAVCLFVAKFVLLPIRVQGISMMPTYQEGRVNFVNRLAYVFHEPKRGDPVAIKLAGEHVMYLKRIIALPGETLEFRRGRVFINGKLLNEAYVRYPCAWDHPPETIGPGEYYVVGDNRTMDFTEHYQGKAWRSQIVGKPLL
ncbi:MAG TPA: signal peptidase I [Verrucomicrobiae bacterium]